MESKAIHNKDLIRRSNTKLVLDTFRTSADTLSQAQLVRQTHLSVGTVVRIVRDLKQQNLLEEIGPGPSRIGRRPTQLRFNPTARYVVAVELEPDEATVALLDLAGGIVAQLQFAVRADQGPNIFYRDLQGYIQQLLKQQRIAKRHVVGLGLCSHGLVDHASGELVQSKHLNWQNVPLKKSLQQHLKVPVWIESTARSMTLGEQRWGAGRGTDNLILVEIDSGIGMIAVMQGQVCRGAHGMAGELGQNLITATFSRTKKSPCLEDVASGKAMMDQIDQAIQTGHTTSLTSQHPTGSLRCRLRQLFTAADKGDELAKRIVKQANQHLAVTIANMVNLYDPEMVILAGCAVTESRGMLVAQVRKIVERHRWAHANRVLRIESASLGNQAALLGIATVVYEKLFHVDGRLLDFSRSKTYDVSI